MWVTMLRNKSSATKVTGFERLLFALAVKFVVAVIANSRAMRL
jgi:hypothetical protein